MYGYQGLLFIPILSVIVVVISSSLFYVYVYFLLYCLKVSCKQYNISCLNTSAYVFPNDKEIFYNTCHYLPREINNFLIPSNTQFIFIFSLLVLILLLVFCFQGFFFVVVFFLKKKTNQSILIAFNSYIPVIFLKLEQFPHLVSLFS